VNHHDLWSLKGVGLGPDDLPRILGCDAAGVDEAGNNVVVHAVVGDPDAGQGDETLDPRRSLLSERVNGTFAELLAVPRRNLIPMPHELTFEEAACLPTAWLTAYRMLFVQAGALPGETVLVQGSTGAVSTAAVALARASGLRVWCTARDDGGRERALASGAHAVFSGGERLPERVDVVIESVGETTWAHSLRALRPGGCIVTCGATTGPNPPADLGRVFFTQLRVLGSTMGTRADFHRLLAMLVITGVRPAIAETIPLAAVGTALREMHEGRTRGKSVITF
jgi:NADPH:quinone reductase-like Zn-dependent oxidoreductase